MLTSRLALTLLVGLAAASSSPALASETMTPEETAAYILFGAKVGQSLYEHETEIKVAKESDAPLVLNLTMEEDPIAAIRVEKQDDCHYNAVFDLLSVRGTSQSLRFGGVFDLSGLKSVEISGQRVYFDGVELNCGGACSDVQKHFQRASFFDAIGMSKPAEQEQADRTAAIAYFHQNICKP